MRAPTARVTWGFPVTKPVLQRLQHIHTQLLKHQKSLIACSKSVSVCTADLPSARKQRAKRGDTADTLSILSLNNTSFFCQQKGFNYISHTVTFFLIILFMSVTCGKSGKK